jgi:hypothetical protein
MRKKRSRANVKSDGEDRAEPKDDLLANRKGDLFELRRVEQSAESRLVSDWNGGIGRLRNRSVGRISGGVRAGDRGNKGGARLEFRCGGEAIVVQSRNFLNKVNALADRAVARWLDHASCTPS